MNTQEAKFILQAYRPGGQDAGDPQFAEALQQARLDPELSTWFAAQTAFDAAATRALREVKAPHHLRESIIAGRRVVESGITWQRPLWWAMAACFLFLLGIAGLWFVGGSFHGYLNAMAAAAETPATAGHLDVVTQDPKQIQGWLADRKVATNYVLPAGLRDTPAMGCRVLTWRGHKVAMLCYMLKGSNHVDLFIARASEIPSPPANGQLQFSTTGQLTTATWTQGDKVYVLMSPENADFLKKYLEVKTAALRNTFLEYPPGFPLPANTFPAQNNPWNKRRDAGSDTRTRRDAAGFGTRVRASEASLQTTSTNIPI
jgi:hypothetical protein